MVQGCELDRLVDVETAMRAEPGGEGASLVVRHREVGQSSRLAELEDRDDVAKVDSFGDARFAEKTREGDRVGRALGPEQLEGDVLAVVAGRAEDEAGCSLAQ